MVIEQPAEYDKATYNTASVTPNMTLLFKLKLLSFQHLLH